MITFIVVSIGLLISSTLACYNRVKLEPVIKTTNTLILLGFAIFFATLNFYWLWIPICIGLLFSANGDLFLALEVQAKESTKPTFFMIGLASFVVGYLCYGIALLIYSKWNVGCAIGLGVLGTIGFTQYVTLDPKLVEGFKIPVIVYLIQIVLLGMGGFGVITNCFSIGTLLILLATLSLYISDSFIGHNLFRKPMKSPDLVIIPSYMLGQSLLILGVFLTV